MVIGRGMFKDKKNSKNVNFFINNYRCFYPKTTENPSVPEKMNFL